MYRVFPISIACRSDKFIAIYFCTIGDDFPLNESSTASPTTAIFSFSSHHCTVMSIPPEVQDHIIDIFSESQRQQRKELLRLRLVCRGWIARVDFHAFHTLTIQITEVLGFLSLIQESAFSIGRHINRLDISGSTTFMNALNDQGCLLYEKYISLSHYHSEFSLHVPHIETLCLFRLASSDIKWAPRFPTIKHLILQYNWLTASQLFDLVSGTTSLESITLVGNRLPAASPQLQLGLPPSQEEIQKGVEDVKGEKAMEEKGSIGLSQSWMHLKKYSTTLPYSIEDSTLESVLFPPNVNPNPIPALTHLYLKNLNIRNFQNIKRLLQDTSGSLRVLKLRFIIQLGMNMNGEAKSISLSFLYSSNRHFLLAGLQKTLDLSRHEKLEHIQIEDLLYRGPQKAYSTHGGLKYAIFTLKSLPKSKRRSTIKVCIGFGAFYAKFYDHSPCNNIIDQLDETLATNDSVREVEVTIRKLQGTLSEVPDKFPLLQAKNILLVSRIPSADDIRD